MKRLCWRRPPLLAQPDQAGRDVSTSSLAASLQAVNSLDAASSILCHTLVPAAFPTAFDHYICKHLVAAVVLVVPQDHVAEHHVQAPPSMK